jgi:hypothetical protein
MTEMFATNTARTVCWEALLKLSYMRYNAKKDNGLMPVGLCATIRNKQVQVDLV